VESQKVSIVEKFSYLKRKTHPAHPQRENVAQEVLARASNFMVARAAFDTSVSLWPVAQIELRQGARVILKSKEETSRL
jgi:hypothetical protein